MSHSPTQTRLSSPSPIQALVDALDHVRAAGQYHEPGTGLSRIGDARKAMTALIEGSSELAFTTAHADLITDRAELFGFHPFHVARALLPRLKSPRDARRYVARRLSPVDQVALMARLGSAARPLFSGVAAAGRYRLCLHVQEDRLALHRLVAFASLDSLVGQARSSVDGGGAAGTKKGARLEAERRTKNILSFFVNVSRDGNPVPRTGVSPNLPVLPPPGAPQPTKKKLKDLCKAAAELPPPPPNATLLVQLLTHPPPTGVLVFDFTPRVGCSAIPPAPPKAKNQGDGDQGGAGGWACLPATQLARSLGSVSSRLASY